MVSTQACILHTYAKDTGNKVSEIQTAVIGAGHLGRFHAQKYHLLANSTLTAVADKDFGKAQEVAAETSCTPVSDYQELLGQVDAVSIVVPTDLHFEVAQRFLCNHTHVLVEKPITATVDQAETLIALARQHGRVLQVGHLERFNPAIVALEKELTEARFIESHRLAPYRPRGTEVNVILDLMIHDIDIILDIVQSDVDTIDARGISVLSDDIDIANARIVFKNGCVANVTASRVSTTTDRKMRIFQNDAYLSVDFHNRELAVYRKGQQEMYPGVPNIDVQRTCCEKFDALLTEIDSFLACIANGSMPKVSGQDGKRALETAISISEQLA